MRCTRNSKIRDSWCWRSPTKRPPKFSVHNGTKDQLSGLLDPGRKVNEAFVVEGIPKSFVYDREGKLVAQSIDMRTRSQFQQMLAQAGLQ